ncbi:amidase domain-containing protein [Desulfobacca acetoxidans]|uniref:Putative amidase domain-containing protein n=1 Tax=Desulfobacca acetoxidans (strain ATCC 700848 / DSM 11109 / ASRB2) TaxID=880072 RepID=F2NC90_DESAR|nr:amidase domain-containing protein [Desulfobacca acetoxidans]AEB08885.1 hypothetical protein Desac_1018 [Desulfobacca acetoxidans DSM 11109]
MQAPERSRKRMAFIECVMIFSLLLMIPYMVQAQQQYHRQGAVTYAQAYAEKYCTDGWIFRTCSGDPVSVTGGGVMTDEDKYANPHGCDCSHFVSCAIGEPGGGLDVDHPYSPYVYGYVGVVALGGWLLSGRGELVDSVNALQPGDVIQYDRDGTGWKHSVVYVGSENICAHSISRLSEHWTSVDHVAVRFIHITIPTAIPTLSEWKRIFFTMVMLSLVLGFVRGQSPVLPSACGSLCIASNAYRMAYNRKLFYKAIRWVYSAAALGLAGATAVFGYVSMPDIVGTLICAPLAAYILHLVLLSLPEGR